MDVQHWLIRLLDKDNAPLTLTGIATDVTAPKLEREFDTTKRAGEAGIVPRPQFFNEVEVSFNIKGTSDGLLRTLMQSATNKITIQLTAITEDNAGVKRTMIWTCKGHFSTIDLGELSESGLEGEQTMMCTYVDGSLGTFSFVYDPANYIFSIDGVNLYADVKTTLGL